MARPRRRWLVRGAIAIALIPLGYVVCTQRVVERPAVSIEVVDAAGRSVADAQVVLHWWSHPHHRHHASHVLRTDAAGRASTTELSHLEMVWPLCMHGVPAHRHTVCVSAPGHGTTVQHLDGERALTIRLPTGEPAEDCASPRAIR